MSEPLLMHGLTAQGWLFVVLSATVVACGNNHVEPSKVEPNKTEPLEQQSAAPSATPGAGEQPPSKPPTMDETEDTQIDKGLVAAPTWDGIRVAIHSPSGELLGSERRSALDLIKSLGPDSHLRILTSEETAHHAHTTSKLVMVTLHPIRHRDGKRFSGGIAKISTWMDGKEFFTHEVEALAESDYVQFGTNELWFEALTQSADALKAVFK